jgi:hypothetical protein
MRGMKDQPVWYLSRNGTQWGPVSHSELLRRAARGDVLEDDLLWRPGFTAWAQASSLTDLLKPPDPPKVPANTRTTFPSGSPGFLGLAQLWRGQKPLWEAFWLYFFAGSCLAFVIGLLLAAAVQYAVEYVIFGRPVGQTAALLLYAPFSWLAPALYQVFAAIGAWRSASWRRLTGILARAYIILSMLILLFMLGSVIYFGVFTTGR